MRRLSVNVAGHHVGLHFVTLHAGARSGTVDGIQHSEQLARPVPIAQRGEAQHCPHCSMRILPAILADAGDVTFYVSGVKRRVVKGRGEEKNQSLRPAHEVSIHGRHGARGPARISSPCNNSPGLSNRVYTTLSISGGAQGSSVVKISAAVPFAVPAFAFDRGFKSAHVYAPGLGALQLAARLCNFGKLP